MNKYSLKAYLSEELQEFASTFKETSLDKENNEYLCKDTKTQNIYDFDRYVKEKCPHPTPASPDAICIGNKDLYFVEFKNQRVADVDKTQMQRKFEDGTKILKELLQEFSPRDCQYHFCVVMKNQPKPRYMDFGHIERNVIRFGLDELNQKLDGFYDHIITESLDFYIDQFEALQCT